MFCVHKLSICEHSIACATCLRILGLEARPVIQPGLLFFEDLQRWEIAQLDVLDNSMFHEHYHAFSVRSVSRSQGVSVSFELCLDAVRKFGFESDYAVLCALDYVQS